MAKRALTLSLKLYIYIYIFYINYFYMGNYIMVNWKRKPKLIGVEREGQIMEGEIWDGPKVH